MTVIVEDGSIVVDANSYISLAEAETYFLLERPNATDWDLFDDETKEASVRFATKLLDTEDWYGYRTSPNTQELAWPRNLVYDADRRQYFQPDEIPKFLKCATAELAVALAREDRTLAAESAAGAGLKKAKIDVLELEWFENSAKIIERAKPLIPSIVCRLIEPYTEGCHKGINVPLFRV